MSVVIATIEGVVIFGYIFYRIYKYMNSESVETKLSMVKQINDGLQTENTRLRNEYEKVLNSPARSKQDIIESGEVAGGKRINIPDDFLD